MKKTPILRIALVSAVVMLSCTAAFGQKKAKKIDVGEALSGYFTLATDEAATPDAKRFIRRWLLLEPISKPNRSNTVFTDSYIRDAFAKEPYEGMFTTPRTDRKSRSWSRSKLPSTSRPVVRRCLPDLRSPSSRKLPSHGMPLTASYST